MIRNLFKVENSFKNIYLYIVIMNETLMYQNLLLHLLVCSQQENYGHNFLYNANNIINDHQFNTILESKPYNIKEFANYFKSYYSHIVSKQLFSQIYSLLKDKISHKFLIYYDSLINQTLTEHQKNIYDNTFNNFQMLQNKSQVKKLMRLINS